MTSDIDRRKSFRSVVHAFREATLVFDQTSVRVCLVDESSDGIRIVADDVVYLTAGVEGLLVMDDGKRLAVKVAYCTLLRNPTLIGLNRLDNSSPSHWRHTRSIQPMSLLIGLAFALSAGTIVLASFSRW